MESELQGIGRVAALSGLTVSALRFYDSTGVLTPAVVDERSGYRWYSRAQIDQARLVARLRRVGLPLLEIGQVLASRSRPAEALEILNAHWRRLEDGLSDARRELSAARELLEQREPIMTEKTWMLLSGRELAAELNAIRFAASADPELAILCGVLFDADTAGGVLRIVATDRYRMAVSSLPMTRSEGPAVRVTASTRFIDEAIALLRDCRVPVRLTVDGDQVTLEADGTSIGGHLVTGDFPEYERLVPVPRADPVVVDVADLRAELEAVDARSMIREQDGESYSLTVLALDQDGVLSVVRDLEPGGGRGTRIGVNREFLLQALNAQVGSQLLLELDGPIAPLALRDPQRADSFSLLMPSRLPESPDRPLEPGRTVS